MVSLIRSNSAVDFDAVEMALCSDSLDSITISGLGQTNRSPNLFRLRGGARKNGKKIHSKYSIKYSTNVNNNKKKS